MALAIGILIGSTLPGNDALLKQQEQLGNRVEAQLELLQQKNEEVRIAANSLELENNTWKQFGKQVMPSLVYGKLEGRSIAVIDTNHYGFSEDLLLTLKSAGATIQSVTTLLNGLDLKDKKTIQEKLGWSETDMTDDETRNRLSEEIAKSILQGDGNQILATLVQLELVKTEGSIGVPLTDVILVGGSIDKEKVHIDTVDSTFIDCFQNNKIPVYGVEQSNVVYSYMEAYQKKRISTVDNIESSPGQLALVMVLSGKQGHFGVKPTAQKLMPELE